MGGDESEKYKRLFNVGEPMRVLRFGEEMFLCFYKNQKLEPQREIATVKKKIRVVIKTVTYMKVVYLK